MKIDWMVVVDCVPMVYAVTMIGSFFIGLSTHSETAWLVFWYTFLFAGVVWLFGVFFGALGILGGIARWARKQ